MTNKSLEEEFRYPIYGRLVNDWELNVEANSLGKVYSKVNPNSELAQIFNSWPNGWPGLKLLLERTLETLG